MARAPSPLYLERRSYWRRRTVDAVRLLPVLGVMLFLVPLLSTAGAEGGSTAWSGIYLFGAWAALICLAAGLSRRLQDEGEGGAGQEGTESGATEADPTDRAP